MLLWRTRRRLKSLPPQQNLWVIFGEILAYRFGVIA
jgi:hypothetical protein